MGYGVCHLWLVEFSILYPRISGISQSAYFGGGEPCGFPLHYVHHSSIHIHLGIFPFSLYPGSFTNIDIPLVLWSH